MAADMGRYLRLYRLLIGARLRSEMQYRVSFIAEIFGTLLVTALDFVAIAILLTRFQEIGSWNLAEVALLYGTSTVSFSLAELLSGAFDGFDKLVVRGEFDRVLIRPLPVAFQMFTGSFAVRRVGRLAQGFVALVWALVILHPAWTFLQWGFFALMLIGGMLFFMAIFILGATMAFWTPQTAELANIFTYGGQFMTSYPMNIYQHWMQSLFTFVIPMAFINYYPALYLLGKPDTMGLPSWIPFASPVVAAVSLMLALQIWRIGVSHYQSTGS